MLQVQPLLPALATRQVPVWDVGRSAWEPTPEPAASRVYFITRGSNETKGLSTYPMLADFARTLEAVSRISDQSAARGLQPGPARASSPPTFSPLSCIRCTCVLWSREQRTESSRAFMGMADCESS